MRKVFIDTFYLVGLLNPKDGHHNICVKISNELEKSGPIRFYTSEFIFAETLTGFSKFSRYWKEKVIEMIDKVRSNPNVEVTPHTTNLYLRAQELYEERLDRDYSHTDCTSMIIMKDKGIYEILTHDHHFEQEGFVILFK